MPENVNKRQRLEKKSEFENVEFLYLNNSYHSNYHLMLVRHVLKIKLTLKGRAMP